MSNRELKEIFKTMREDRNKGVDLLYSSCYNKLYAIAFMICKDHHLSEDAVHNLILKLMVMEVDNLPRDNEVAWLNKVIKNATIDIIRKEMRTVPSCDLEKILNKKTINNYVELNGFDEMLVGLDEKRKNVITLKVLGNYTFNEISIITGINPSTARWFYNTGISKLKKSLAALASITLSFVLLFIVSLVIELAWLDVEFQNIISVVGLTWNGMIGNATTNITIHPNTVLLIYSGMLSILLVLFFCFCYHNAYELPTKAMKQKHNRK